MPQETDAGWKCSDCDRRFDTKGEAEEHERLVGNHKFSEEIVEIVACEKCGVLRIGKPKKGTFAIYGFCPVCRNQTEMIVMEGKKGGTP